MPRLHFVQELPAGSSTRDQELERAKARAHAALVSCPPPPPKTGKSRRARSHTSVRGDRKYAASSSDSATGFTSVTSALAQNEPDTPPESPGRRNSLVDQSFSPLSLDHAAENARGQVLTPPDSNWPESISGERDPDADLSSSSSSGALIQSTRNLQKVYRITPHAQHTAKSPMPWSQANNVNLNSIPHGLLGTRADPFDCNPRRHAHSVSVDTVTDYHAQIMAPNHAPMYKIFNVTNVYTAYYFELLTHPDFLYTGVASVQAIIDHLKRRPDEPVGPSEQVMKYIGVAMGRLRKRLGRLQKKAREDAAHGQHQHQKPTSEAMEIDDDDARDFNPSQPASTSTIHNPTLLVDDMTIMTVLFLAVVTRAINDMHSHEIHKRTIASLVAARGGLSNMTGHDGLARCTLMQWESFWALNTGVMIFPEARPPYSPIYPAIPLDELSELGRKVATLPLGLQNLVKQKRLALDVVEVLSRTAQAHIEQDLHGTIVTPADVFRTKPRKFQDFWEACSCLSAPDETYIDGEGISTAMPNLEKLIVLALLLHCLHTFSPARAITAVCAGSRLKLMTDLPRRVKRAIPSTCATSGITSMSHTDMETAIESEEAVLLWVYFNLVDGWRAANDSLLPSGVALMLDVRTRFPAQTRSWVECEAVLKQFFWNEKFASRCTRFWSSGEVEMQRERMRRENG